MSKKLTIELIPSTAWNNNLRTLLGKEKWRNLRAKVIEAWGQNCAICGQSTKRLDCHEVWKFQTHPHTHSHTQSLTDIIPLCKLCHGVKHIGLSELQASQHLRNFELLIAHYMRVNGCSREEFEKDKAQAYKLFEKRSKISWRLALKGVSLE